MQFEYQKAFPHPVLRSDIDDYVDADFQASIQFEIAPEEKIKATINMVCSVVEIEDLISSKRAEYLVVFECKDTFTRVVARSFETEFEYMFEAGSVRGEVTASAYIVAVDELKTFRSAQLNPEFGDGNISFPKSSVLAIEVPSAVFIDRELFKPTSSLFELVQSEGLTGTMWKLQTEQDRVQIAVSPAIKAKLDGFRSNKKNKAILLNSIYFAAVMECVHLLQAEEEDNDGHRWRRTIRQRCSNLGISLKTESSHEVAQKLMSDPFGRFDAYLLSSEA